MSITVTSEGAIIVTSTAAPVVTTGGAQVVVVTPSSTPVVNIEVSRTVVITSPVGTTGPQGPPGPAGPEGPPGTGGGGAAYTILSGPGAPDVAVGVPGDFYVDNYNQDLYGPKSEDGYGVAEFASDATVSPTNTGSSPFRVGHSYRMFVEAQIVGGRFHRSISDSRVTRVMTLFNTATQTLLATSNPTVEVAGTEGWVEATFPTPVNVAANALLTICFDVTAYGFDTNAPPLMANPFHVAFITGRWGTEGVGFPNAGANVANFFSDLKFRPAGPPWPLAVPGEVKTYIYNQITPAATWTIPHGLGVWPSVTVVDSGGNHVLGDVNYIDANTVQLKFSKAFGGNAYLNT